MVASLATHYLKASPKPDSGKSLVVTPHTNWGGLAWVEVPAGEFWMGREDGHSDEKPHHLVHLDQYWLSKTAVTNQQYLVFVQATGQAIPSHWKSGSIPEGKENHPVVCMCHGSDALAYSRWLSKLIGRRLGCRAKRNGRKGREV